MKPLLIYCYDAYCGWCYGFSPVLHSIAAEFGDQLDVEVLSGGMLLPEKPVHISAMASYIAKAYPNVEATTGIKFGQDFLWHIFNPEESDWYPHSEKSAIALIIFKEFYPDQALSFATDLQIALNKEGRDLTDDEAYRHLLGKYNIDEELFYQKLHEPAYKLLAHEEFDLVKRLQVQGYPAVFLQMPSGTFHLLANGYTSKESLIPQLQSLLSQV
jgi:putative protein-disulfide isomerase